MFLPHCNLSTYFFSIPGLTSAVPGLMVVLKEKLVVVM